MFDQIKTWGIVNKKVYLVLSLVALIPLKGNYKQNTLDKQNKYVGDPLWMVMISDWIITY